MNNVEREAIVLNTAWGMIDDMVNWAVFVRNERDHHTSQMFQTAEHRRLFVILLRDFLSDVRAEKGGVPLNLSPQPPKGSPSDRTFLFHLRQVCASPKLDADVSDLSSAVEEFASWLETEFLAAGVNFDSLGAVDLTISRYRYLRMCGDIAKHNLTRLSRNVQLLSQTMEAAGKPVSQQEAYLLLDAFFRWFYDDILLYHASSIAALLNNIRWSIYEYLRPEYLRSWHRPEGSPAEFYAFRYPDGLVEPVARGMYWDLMNRVRRKPWIRPFTVSPSLTTLY